MILKSKDDRILDAIRIGFNEGMVDFTENLRQLVDRGRDPVFSEAMAIAQVLAQGVR